MAIRREIEPGQRYGMLTVIGEGQRARSRNNVYRMVHAVCDCGKPKTMKLSNLREGAMHSCGCYRAGPERARKNDSAAYRRKACIAACKKIEKQFDKEVAESRLMCAVVCAAVMDLSSRADSTRRSARRYLNGEIWNAELAGVDSDWIRHVLVTMKLIS